MKLSRTIQRDMTTLGLGRNQRPFNALQLKFILNSLTTMILHFTYIVQVANTPKEYMDGILMSSAATLFFIAFLCSICQTTTISTCIDLSEETVEKRLIYPRSRAMYEKSNRLVEKLSRMVYFVMVKVSIVSMALPKAMLSYYSYLTTDLRRSSFDLPLPMWFPFDWKNPVGYAIAVAFQCLLSLHPMRFIACFLSYGFSAFLFSISVGKDLKHDLNILNRQLKTEPFRCQILKKLIEFIDLHTSMKQQLDYFSEIYHAILTVLFAGCTGAICLGLLMIQQELQSHNESNTVLLLEAIFYGVWAINLVLVVCELGQRFTNTFDEIDERIRKLDWYLLPIEIKRMQPTIILYAQQPIGVKFFGSMSCCREQFKKVINAGYSCFMLLRKLY